MAINLNNYDQSDLPYYTVYIKNSEYNHLALQHASQKGHLEVVKFLVEKGTNIHDENDFNVRWASRNGHLDVVKYLVEKGANIHAKNNEALRLASYNGRSDVVNFLQSL